MAAQVEQKGRGLVPICCPRHPEIHQTRPGEGGEGLRGTEGLSREDL